MSAASVSFRDHLRDARTFRPGASIDEIIRTSDHADVLRLSNNENAWGPLPVAREAAIAAMQLAHRYPDDEALELRRALAERYDTDLNSVAVGCGSLDILLQLLTATVDVDDEVVFGWPSFGEYDRMTQLCGGRAKRIALVDHAFDLSGIAAAITERTKVVIICNPNSPTGTLLPNREIEAFVEGLPRDILVVIDEAYAEFVTTDAPTGISIAKRHSNVVTLRTFSKAYGLAGLRVGYAVAHESIVERLSAVHLTFAVSRAAQMAALASLGPVGQLELKDRVETTQRSRSQLIELLDAKGFSTTQSVTNFVQVAVQSGSAERFVALLELRGALVRPIGSDHLRVAVGTEEQNVRFVALLTEVGEAVQQELTSVVS